MSLRRRPGLGLEIRAMRRSVASRPPSSDEVYMGLRRRPHHAIAPASCHHLCFIVLPSMLLSIWHVKYIL